MSNDPNNYWASSPFPAPVAYPKWKYHATEPAVQVRSAEEEEALGEGWGDAYVIRPYPKMKFGKGGKTAVVNNPDEEAKLEGHWTDKPDPADTKQARNAEDRTLTEVMEDARAGRRKALDYQQVNYELELKADNAPMKPLQGHESSQPVYEEPKRKK